jgi:hypothetical protein
MKNFFLLVTIILSFNSFAQYSGGGIYLTFADLQNITVKWSNTNNQVITKTATYTANILVNYREYAQYKVKNSSDFFVVKKAIYGDGYYINYYNELDRSYWGEEKNLWKD